MVYRNAVIEPSLRNPLDEQEEEAAKETFSRRCTLIPAALRDTNKLATLNVQTIVHSAHFLVRHDRNAYSIGQQRVQSMPQALAKSRTNPADFQRLKRVCRCP